MNQLRNYILSLLAITFLCACSDVDDTLYRELEWSDLKPIDEAAQDERSMEGSLEIVDDWYTDDYAPGGGIGRTYDGTPLQAYSSGFVAELDQTSARVPGFVVPVEFEGESLVTEFFLVPYFGACFHKPPPPPNQTIYVVSSKPVEYSSIYDPVWVAGVITTKQKGNDIATAAYTMDLHKLVPYDE